MRITLSILILFIFSSAHAQKSATDTIIVCGNKVPILRTAERNSGKSFFGGGNIAVANDIKQLENQLKLQKAGNSRYWLYRLQNVSPHMDVSLYENEIRAYESCDSLNAAIKSQQYLAQQTAKIKYDDSIKTERTLERRKADSIQLASMRHNEEVKEKEIEKEELKKTNEDQLNYRNSIIKKYGKSTASKIFAHQVSIGMTMQECESSIGKPRKKETNNVANMVVQIWTYKDTQYISAIIRL